jgi:hypothetical protein
LPDVVLEVFVLEPVPPPMPIIASTTIRMTTAAPTIHQIVFLFIHLLYHGAFYNKKRHPARGAVHKELGLFYGILAAYDPYEEQDNGCHEKNVDESADGVRGDKTQYPKNKQYDCDRYEHIGD